MTLVTSREAPKSKYEQFNKKNPFFRSLRRKKILSYFFPSLAIPYRFGASKKLVIKLKKPFHLKCCGTDAELREQRLDLVEDDEADGPSP